MQPKTLLYGLSSILLTNCSSLYCYIGRDNPIGVTPATLIQQPRVDTVYRVRPDSVLFDPSALRVAPETVYTPTPTIIYRTAQEPVRVPVSKEDTCINGVWFPKSR